MTVNSKIEGWTWLSNARKWHYFREGRSLCGQQMLLRHPSEGYELGNNDSSSNCAGCRRKLETEASKLNHADCPGCRVCLDNIKEPT